LKELYPRVLRRKVDKGDEMHSPLSPSAFESRVGVGRVKRKPPVPPRLPNQHPPCKKMRKRRRRRRRRRDPLQNFQDFWKTAAGAVD